MIKFKYYGFTYTVDIYGAKTDGLYFFRENGTWRSQDGKLVAEGLNAELEAAWELL